MASADSPGGGGGGDPIVPSDAPEPPENPVLRHLAWKPMWIENSNAVWVVVGDPGDGKSYSSLRIGETVWPGFTIDAVASNIVEFLQLVMDDSYGQGSVVVLEEGGVEASAYEWYSKSNEVFRTVLETWRHQNRMAIINLPNFKALDKGARRRTDVIIEMLEAQPWKDYSVAKPKEVDYNNIDDYLTTPFPILEGKRHKRIRFRPPSQDLIDDYESVKEEYNKELLEDLLEQLIADQEEATAEDEKDPQKIADTVLENEGVDHYLADNNGQRYLDRDLLEMEYDIGGKRSKKVKKLLLREVDDDVM